ncbi:Glycosyl transferase family protein [Sphingomonas antarctica]|uniref:glycosyl transferase family protein n=1 Tax=Sphingomonas antarctica TaxID=2040274 RepID=UPI0039ED2622
MIAARELALFAAAGFLIGGIDELLVDLAWAARSLRRAVAFRRRPRATVATLPLPAASGRFAIFIPAWDESAVIGAMLRHLLGSFGDCVVYVAIYPNDPATAAVLAAIADSRLRVVVNERAGPTTKADALNTLWRAMRADEICDGAKYRGVVLHDAEDVVHPDELIVFASLIDRFAMIQLPVLPLVDRGSRWIAGTYLDEFAEHHGKTLLAREETGAGIPSAGVGCVFARAALETVTAGRDGPFDAASLTEDYELGLRLRAAGGRAAFVRIEGSDGKLVATHEHFPATLEGAIKQRGRWIAGIALHGWDRLNWHGGVAERWMRARDRRTLIASTVLAAGYVALLLWAGLWLFGRGTRFFDLPAWLTISVTALMVWRLAVRAAFVVAAYGWRQGLLSFPRTFVANAILIAASWRAVRLYRESRRSGMVRWDKTAHVFPQSPLS